MQQLAEITNVPLNLTRRIEALASAFWPGPLTLLLPRNATIPDAVTAGRELVGVRVPAHPAAQALLRATGLPIAAPSANLFGHTSPTTAAHVLADLDTRIDAILDAGSTSIGLESTVLDPTQTPMVLYRPGAISPEQLTAATGIAVTVFTPAITDTAPESLPSPGVGIRHYAPRAKLILVEPIQNNPQKTFLNANNFEQGISQRIGVMLPDSWDTLPQSHTFAWGSWSDLNELANRLFAGLRTLDDQGVDVILCPLPPPGPLADAIRDRLTKAGRPA
jgi:L-threonylcarbamoyladenylate synthase